MGESVLGVTQLLPEATATSSETSVHAVTGTLRQWICGGKWAIGQRLPAERELSTRLKVDRSAVRKALAQLTDEGLVRRTSPRMRIVSNAPQRRSWLISNAVTIISPPPDVQYDGHLLTGWSEYVAQGAFAAARQRNWNVLAIPPQQLDEQAIEHLVAERPKGVILPEVHGDRGVVRNLIRAADDHALPLVVYEQGDLSDCDSVASDHYAGAHALTNWLIARGRRRILPVFERREPQPWSARRIAGYRAAMTEAGLQPLDVATLPPIPETHGQKKDFDDAAHMMAGYLVTWLTCTKPIDALMVVSDRPAYFASAAVRLFGLTPHQDVSIVGYDNYWQDCINEQKFETAGPQATVDKQNVQVGQALIELLEQRLNGSTHDQPQRRVVAPRLIECI